MPHKLSWKEDFGHSSSRIGLLSHNLLILRRTRQRWNGILQHCSRAIYQESELVLEWSQHHFYKMGLEWLFDAARRSLIFHANDIKLPSLQKKRFHFHFEPLAIFAVAISIPGNGTSRQLSSPQTSTLTWCIFNWSVGGIVTPLALPLSFESQ